jgi:hypothetical protein
MQTAQSQVVGRITDIKYCGRGKHHLHRDEFSESTVTKDGKQDWCKQCMKLYRAAKKASKEIHVEPSV